MSAPSWVPTNNVTIVGAPGADSNFFNLCSPNPAIHVRIQPDTDHLTGATTTGAYILGASSCNSTPLFYLQSSADAAPTVRVFDGKLGIGALPEHDLHVAGHAQVDSLAIVSDTFTIEGMPLPTYLVASNLAGAYVGETAPAAPWSGAFWFETTSNVLYVYAASNAASNAQMQWTAVGGVGTGTGGALTTLTDVVGPFSEGQTLAYDVATSNFVAVQMIKSINNIYFPDSAGIIKAPFAELQMGTDAERTGLMLAPSNTLWLVQNDDLITANGLLYAFDAGAAAWCNAFPSAEAYAHAFVRKAGDIMTGALYMSNLAIKNLALPTASGDAANKNYVDTAILGRYAQSFASNEPLTSNVGDLWLDTTGAVPVLKMWTTNDIWDTVWTSNAPMYVREADDVAQGETWADGKGLVWDTFQNKFKSYNLFATFSNIPPTDPSSRFWFNTSNCNLYVSDMFNAFPVAAITSATTIATRIYTSLDLDTTTKAWATSNVIGFNASNQMFFPMQVPTVEAVARLSPVIATTTPSNAAASNYAFWYNTVSSNLFVSDGTEWYAAGGAAAAAVAEAGVSSLSNLQDVLFSNVTDGQVLTYSSAKDRFVFQNPGYTHSNEWFVDPNFGSDASSGKSSDAPFKTLQNAVEKAGNYDVVYLMTGPYTESGFATFKPLSLIGVGAPDLSAMTINYDGNDGKMLVRNVRFGTISGYGRFDIDACEGTTLNFIARLSTVRNSTVSGNVRINDGSIENSTVGSVLLAGDNTTITLRNSVINGAISWSVVSRFYGMFLTLENCEVITSGTAITSTFSLDKVNLYNTRCVSATGTPRPVSIAGSFTMVNSVVDIDASAIVASSNVPMTATFDRLALYNTAGATDAYREIVLAADGRTLVTGRSTSNAVMIYNWTLDRAYQKGDIVQYENVLYIANSNVQANVPLLADADYGTWFSAISPATSSLKAFNWSLSSTYKASDLAVYNNGLYQANGDIEMGTSFVTGWSNGTTWTPITGLAAYNTNTLYMHKALAQDFTFTPTQAGVHGQTVPFQTTRALYGLTPSTTDGAYANGIRLFAGRTYRLEAALNTIDSPSLYYIGYQFATSSNANVGGATTSFASNASYFGASAYTFALGYGSKSTLLEYYSPSVDTDVYVNIIDVYAANTSNNLVSSKLNTYFVAQEVPQQALYNYSYLPGTSNDANKFLALASDGMTILPREVKLREAADVVTGGDWANGSSFVWDTTDNGFKATNVFATFSNIPPVDATSRLWFNTSNCNLYVSDLFNAYPVSAITSAANVAMRIYTALDFDSTTRTWATSNVVGFDSTSNTFFPISVPTPAEVARLSPVLRTVDGTAADASNAFYWYNTTTSNFFVSNGSNQWWPIKSPSTLLTFVGSSNATTSWTAPSPSNDARVWYDTSASNLYLSDNKQWWPIKSSSSPLTFTTTTATASNACNVTTPTPLVAGDERIWYDTTTSNLRVSDGTKWWLANAVTTVTCNVPVEAKKIIKMTDNGYNGMLSISSDGALYVTRGTNSVFGAYHDGVQDTNNVYAGMYGILNTHEILFSGETGRLVDADVYGAATFAWFDSGNLYTWGNNGYGQLGRDGTTHNVFPKLATTNVTKVFNTKCHTGYVTGAVRLIVQKNDGLVYGTGYNGYGQLGLGNTTSLSTFTALPLVGAYPKAVFNMGDQIGSLYVQKADGSIWVAGYNGWGNLGRGNTTDVTTLSAAPLWNGGSNTWVLKDVVGGYGQYNGGYGNNCTTMMWFTDAADTVDYLRSCGYHGNAAGILGNNTTATEYLSSPVVVTLPVGAGRIKKVLAIGEPTVFKVLDVNGNLYSWGRNDEGQVGNGTQTAVIKPTLVQSGVLDLIFNGSPIGNFAYYALSFIRKGDGIYVCGNCRYGESGTGKYDDNYYQTSYTKVALPTNFKLSCAGRYSTTNAASTIIMIDANTSQWYAWGYNGHYAIDASSGNTFYSPVSFVPPVLCSPCNTFYNVSQQVTAKLSVWDSNMYYPSTSFVSFNGALYQANTTVDALTPFVVGTSANQWSLINANISASNAATTLFNTESFSVSPTGQTQFLLQREPLGKPMAYRNGALLTGAAISYSGNAVNYSSSNNANVILQSGDRMDIAYAYGSWTLGTSKFTRVLNQVVSPSTAGPATLSSWSGTYTASGGTVIVDVTMSAYATTAGQRILSLQRDGVAIATKSFYFNNTGLHIPLDLRAILPNETGTHVYSIAIPTSVTVDTGDYLTMDVQEYGIPNTTVANSGYAASFMRAVRTTAQTSGLTANSPVVFTSTEAQTGADITLNTTTGVFTLQPNRIYRLRGTHNVATTNGNGGTQLTTQWFNVTAGTYVGNASVTVTPQSTQWSSYSGDAAEIVLYPSVLTQVVLNIKGVANTLQIEYPWADIEVIGANQPVVGQTQDNVYVKLSADQTTHLVGGTDHVKFDTVYGSAATITLSTAAYATAVATNAVGRFTLKGGYTYRLTGSVGASPGTSGNAFQMYWRNAETGTQLPAGNMSLQIYANVGGAETAEAIFSPTSDTRVELFINLNAGITALTAANSYAIVQQIGTSAAIATTAIKEWAAYTPTVKGVTSDPTPGAGYVANARYKVVGKSMHIQFSLCQGATAGVAGVGKYLFPIPGGYVIDTSVAPGCSASTFGGYRDANAVGTGQAFRQAETAAHGEASAVVWNSTNLALFGFMGTSGPNIFGGDWWGLDGAYMGFKFIAEVPIL